MERRAPGSTLDGGEGHTSPAPATASAEPQPIGMFFSMDAVAADDALSILEDGEPPSAEDFELGAAASAGMEEDLSTMQLHAFLSRAESDVAAPPAQATAANDKAEKVPTTVTPTPLSEYEAARGTVFYSRREDKIRALQDHPLVAAVAADGRQVTCRCGRAVRLNPPWYILKFEQHVVSRNCTFLRSKKPKKAKSGSRMNDASTFGSTAAPVVAASLSETSDRTVPNGHRDADTDRDAAATTATAEGEDGDSGSTAAAEPQDDVTDVSEPSARADGSRIQDGGAPVAVVVPLHAAPSGNASAPSSSTSAQPSLSTGTSGYALQQLEVALGTTFTITGDGTILPPSPKRREAALGVANDNDALQRQFAAAVLLRSHAYFSRVTPDGRFVECTCGSLVALSAPWDVAKFLEHVAAKQAPPKKKRTKTHASSARLTPQQQQQRRVPVVTKRKLGEGAAIRLKKKSFPSEVHWDLARTRRLLPCPGLRDEKMEQFVEAAVHLTGGARPRFKIAQDLFPDLFLSVPSQQDETGCLREEQTGAVDDNAFVPAEDVATELGPPAPPPADSTLNTADLPTTGSAVETTIATATDVNASEEAMVSAAAQSDPEAAADAPASSSSSRASGDERVRVSYRLTADQKLLLHDAIEAEVLWFIDKDGSSVRSLDCRGIVDTGTGAVECGQCAALRSNLSLRSAVAFMAKRARSSRNPLNRKFCSSRVFSALAAEFNMDDEFARILRDLSLAEIADSSALNVWFDVAEMGLHGLFDTNAAFVGLVECMVARKNKERRGVGMQNMLYSEPLDEFLRALTAVSEDACAFFQHHLCGRTQSVRQIGRKRKSAAPTSSSSIHTSHSGDNEADASMSMDEQSAHHLLYDTTSALGQTEGGGGFPHLLDASNGAIMSSLSMSDMHDVDLSSFSASAAREVDDLEQQLVGSVSPRLERRRSQDSADSERGFLPRSPSSPQHATTHSDDDDDENDDDDDDDDAFLSVPPVSLALRPPEHEAMALPCPGLRDDKYQAYVRTAVQVIGGSRPRYVIAKELFPDVFGHAKTVKIVETLDEAQKRVLQDAVFSECLWRVDKAGGCVRSLRCQRLADATATAAGGACRACRDLKAVPNFRSVLSRAKAPKLLANVKFLPSAYTESDPFLRKLSKNASFRALYERVRERAPSAKKTAAFWLRCARLGVFGSFRTHPVFEGLLVSMVEVKDKQQRGVGKQNMQYPPPLDDFMHALAAISLPAFDLFASHFCGRSLRSQKVKKRKVAAALAVAASVDNEGQQPLEEPHRLESTTTNVMDVHQPLSGQRYTPPSHHHHHHHLLAADELLGGRPLTVGDLEEHQRLMDRMLDAVASDFHLQDDVAARQQPHQFHQSDNGGDAGAPLMPRTYVDERGVLTTEI